MKKITLLTGITILMFFTRLTAFEMIPSAHPQISVNGEQVVFFSYNRETGYSVIKSYNLQTKKTVVLVEDDFFNSNASLSPDGKYLAYSSARPDFRGQWDIYILNIETGKTKNLTKTDAREMHPFWTPDGKRISFIRDIGEGETAIFRIQPDGSNEEQLTAIEGSEFHPKWSQDSKLLVFDAGPFRNDRRIDILNTETQTHRILVEAEGNIRFSAPSVSPDLEHVVYSASGTTDKGGSLWMVNIKSLKKTLIHQFKTGISVGGPVMSDNKTIIFHRNEKGVPELYSIQTDGKNLKRLIEQQQ